MTDGKEKVIDKIRKMMAHQASAEKIGSKQEAEAFAAKIQELLIQHELEMSEIPLEARDMREETIDQEVFRPWEKGWSGSKRQYWLLQLAEAVAHAHMCRLLVHPHDNTVWFVGKPHNRAVCVFMYEYLIRTARNLNYIEYTKAAREAKKVGDPGMVKGFITAFYEAFSRGIRLRYEEMRRQADATSSTALVLRSTEQQLQQYMSKFTRTVAGPRSKGYNQMGSAAGSRVAREVNLSVKGVGSQNASRKEIK